MGAGILGVILLCAGIPEAFPPDGQWDFETYYYASKTLAAGGNPADYRQLAETAGHQVLPFVYPHHTLLFFRLFALDDLSTAKYAYLAAKLGCVVALCVLWTTCFVPAGVRGWFLAFAALGYSATIWRDLVAGNVSLFEQTLIWFGLLALLRGRLWLFCGLIILAGQFKLLPLCLLGLVLLTDSPRKWRCLAASVAACGIIAGAVYLSNPQAARMFVQNAANIGSAEPGGEVNPCALAFILEVTTKAMERISALDGISPAFAAKFPQAAYVLALLAAVGFSLRHRLDLRGKIFLALLTLALVAPRMKDYSYVLLLLPTFELLRLRLTRGAGEGMLLLAVAALLALPGLDDLWRYRPLLLAAWVWVIALKMKHTARLGA